MLLRKKLFYVLWNGSQQLDLRSAVADLKVKRIITSKLSIAVLYTVQALQKNLVFR
jgi:hypothetical protein